MSDWLRVDVTTPCRICGKADWCSRSADGAYAICRRVADVGTGEARGRVKVDRAGAEYWVYKVGEPSNVISLAPPRPTTPPPPAASASDLHAVYAALLNGLSLVAADRDALRARGLNDHSILRNRYRTLPRTGRARLVKRLVESFGEDLLRRTPGVIARDGYLTLAGGEGLLIPVRNVEGQIVALKCRRREVTPSGPRYTYLSSNDRGGRGPGSPVHVPVGEGRARDVVRLTEGELKADVATALDQCLTISIAGVGTWRQALPVLKALGARTCRLAFDADVRSNVHVASALKNAAEQVVREGFALELETWDPKFKGIDDCLAAGARPEVIAGEDAFGEVGRLFALARASA